MAQELHVELANRDAYLGNIYKGKVVNIEPSIGAAFVAFGGRVNGFLHVSDVLPAYGRDEFRLEDVIEGRARVDVDDGPESMQLALSDDDEDDGDAGSGDAGSGDAESGDATATAPRKSSKRGSRRSKGAAEGPSDEGAAPESGDETASSGQSEPSPSDPSEVHEDQEPAIEAVEDVDVGVEIASHTEEEHAEDEHGDADADEADAAGDDSPADADPADPADPADAAEDDADDDGFGDGLTERPLAMAAADPEDESAAS
ncbi:MAG TPA: S1 RNA-binding domain-containing protein, partial [Planctomycetes bacterium]|nr:S1 RNA-binding domain-containing protein [Planctomycetota bacterium]